MVTKSTPRRFRERSIPAAAKRLGIPPHELRRAVERGDVQTFQWNGLRRISQEEEQRIGALLQK
jgi:hypothetical protein